MGRTLLPYSMQIELTSERFREYRRGLRKHDQNIFDRLIRYARLQLQSGVMASCPNPFDAMAMAIFMELQRQVDELKKRIEYLEEEIDQKNEES